jgi:polar amino acid transport system substrate-binding protein
LRVKASAPISAVRAWLAAVLAVSLWASLAWAQEPPARLHFADSPFPPYLVGQEGGPARGGAAVALVRGLFARLGIEVSITLHPWQRTLHMVKAGRADGVCLVMHSKERESYLAYSRPLFHARESLYYRQDRLPGFSWRGLADLKPYRIGVVAGYTYGGGLLRAVSELGLKVEPAPSGRRCLKKLIAGRIDLYVEEESVARTLLAELPGGERVAKAERPLSVFAYHLALARGTGAHRLLPRLNRVLERMHREGEVRRILAEWGITPAAPPGER